MGKDSALYQLMDVRMNGVMNGIVSSDGEYQAVIRKYGLKNFCDYPIQIYSKEIQFLLTFIVPYAFTGKYGQSIIKKMQKINR